MKWKKNKYVVHLGTKDKGKDMKEYNENGLILWSGTEYMQRSGGIGWIEHWD